MADDLLQEAARQGLATVSMHPSHMLGPHDKAGWIRMFDDAAAGKLKAAPGGRASFSLVAQVALAHIAAAEHPSPASRHVLGGPAATYLEVFGRIAHLVGAKPVTSTIPAPALRAIGQLSDLWSGVTAGRPAMTPGLAQILTGDMLGDATLAEMQLGYRLPDLASILDATFAAWAGARLSSAPESPCCPAP
jgi:nucleoside-diphosphate-sugar epimerase